MLCDNYGDYCQYSTLLCDPEDERSFTACDYIGATGKRRPCQAGSSCTVRVEVLVPNNVNRRTDTERQRLHRRHVSATLQGEQAAVILDFMRREGYTINSLAEKLKLYPNTVRKWVREYGFANWKDLETIGLKKPDGMPTSETHPRIKKNPADCEP